MPITASGVLASRLAVLQSFQEVTWGTTGAATAKWMGVQPFPTFKPYVKVTEFDEDRGSLAPGYLSSQVVNGGEFTINQHASYEDILYMLQSALGVVAPTGGPVYVWAYSGPTTAGFVAQPYTFEYGYNAAGTALVNGAIVNKFSIKGESKKQWETSMSGFFKTWTQVGSAPTALANRTVEVILMPVTTLALDAAGANPGTTAVTNSLLSFGLDIETGLTPIWTSDSKGPSIYTYDKAKATLTMKLIWSSAVKTYINTPMEAGLPGVFQIKSTSSTKVAQIDFAGVLIDDPTWFQNQDGAMVMEIKVAGQVDAASSLANAFKISISNGVATLT